MPSHPEVRGDTAWRCGQGLGRRGAQHCGPWVPPPSPPSGLCTYPSLCLGQGLCPVCGLTPGGHRAMMAEPRSPQKAFGFNRMAPNTAGTAWPAVAGPPASPRPSLTLRAQSGPVGQGMQHPRRMGRHVPGRPGQGTTSVPRPLQQGLDGQPMGPPAGGPCGEMAGCGTESQSLREATGQLLPAAARRGKAWVPELGLQKEVQICAGCPQTGSPAATQETHPGVEPSPWPPSYTPCTQVSVEREAGSG